MDLINIIAPSTGTGFNGFLVNAISWLTKITSSIALGIILFTIILKLITLPFDFMSRYSMRKNSIKMEQMRPELEKLQKQYADDKALYNQKMLALQKKNGYSMWGACLPTILTLVIFIVAINGFTSYSNYQNRKYYYEMSNAYNNVIYAGIEVDGEIITRDKNGKIIVDDQTLYSNLTEGSGTYTIGSGESAVSINYEKGTNDFGSYYLFVTENGYVQYKTYFDGTIFKNPEFTVVESKLSTTTIKTEENNELKTSKNQTYSEAKSAAQTEKGINFNIDEFVKEFFQDIMSMKSAQSFRSVKASFLWVKNIWVTDSPFSHPVNSSADSLAVRDNESCACSCNGKTTQYLTSDQYNRLTEKLSQEKSAPNGYFILVVLTALSSLFMQIVTSKSQKAQMELQTVNGQGAQTQKMMTWMMPILMAVFAFMYTSAFAIYIILSSLISLGTTFAINAIVNKKFNINTKKKNAEPVHGRVYVPKEQPKEEKKDNKKKKQEEKVDFLNSEAKNRHIRGRKK